MSEQSAQRMMNVAREYGSDKSPNLRDLKRSVLYELAAPSTPPEVRDKIGPRIVADEKSTVADVQALKREMEQRAFVVEYGIPASKPLTGARSRSRLPRRSCITTSRWRKMT